jgi:hypothetical protein
MVEGRRDAASQNGRWYEGAVVRKWRWMSGGRSDTSEQGDGRPRRGNKDTLGPKEDGGDGGDGLTWLNSRAVKESERRGGRQED